MPTEKDKIRKDETKKEKELGTTFFQKSAEAAVTELKSNASDGLSSQEAEKRLGDYGLNRLEGKKEATLLQMFLRQFMDFLVLILIIAAGTSIFLKEYLDGSIILAIVEIGRAHV